MKWVRVQADGSEIPISRPHEGWPPKPGDVLVSFDSLSELPAGWTWVSWAGPPHGGQVYKIASENEPKPPFRVAVVEADSPVDPRWDWENYVDEYGWG